MISRFFQITNNQTTIKTEVHAGLTNFLTTSYIFIVNPMILSQCGMPFEALVTSTIILAAVSTLLMGLHANMPIVIAPGMGINAFFAFSIVLGLEVPWEIALGMVFWTGVLFILMSIFNIRTLLLKAIPHSLRYAIAAGIGLFIAFIGLSNASFIVDHPATLVTRAPLSSENLTFLAGLFITSIFLLKKKKSAFLMGILVTTILAFPIGRWWGESTITTLPKNGWLSAPDFQLFFAMDLWGSLKLSLIPSMFALFFTDLFDSLSTFVGLSEAGDLKDPDGEPKNIKECLGVDAFSSMLSGLFGTSSGTSFIESAAGIHQGGRTGLTAAVTALCFLPCIFIAPTLAVIPKIATAPVLVLVGVLMITPILKIKFQELDQAIPALIAILLIPLTYSITQGILWSFLIWTLLRIAQGKSKQIPFAMWVINILMVGFLILEAI